MKFTYIRKQTRHMQTYTQNDYFSSDTRFISFASQAHWFNQSLFQHKPYGTYTCPRLFFVFLQIYDFHFILKLFLWIGKALSPSVDKSSLSCRNPSPPKLLTRSQLLDLSHMIFVKTFIKANLKKIQKSPKNV